MSDDPQRVTAEMTIFRESDYLPFLRPIRSMGVIVILGMILIAGCALGDSRSDSKDVVYSVEVDGNIDVFKIDSATGDSLRLTTSDGSDLAPAWSPNKERIAFISDRNGKSALWLMDPSGDAKRQVTSPGIDVVNFRWSPDSVRIAVEALGQGVRTISILDTETDEMVALTAPSEDVRVGDWSPDGEWVVYSAVEGADSAIRRRNPTGVDEITLAITKGTNPRWSQNGQWIAYSRMNESGSFDLVVIDKDGDNESVVASGINGEVPHDWAPDGRQIVYVGGSEKNAEIFVVGRNGKNLEQLTSNRVADAGPRWNPDGASILFLSEGDGSFDVYSMERNGEQQVRMTTTVDLVLSADW